MVCMCMTDFEWERASISATFLFRYWQNSNSYFSFGFYLASLSLLFSFWFWVTQSSPHFFVRILSHFIFVNGLAAVAGNDDVGLSIKGWHDTSTIQCILYYPTEGYRFICACETMMQMTNLVGHNHHYRDFFPLNV
jgi:hypothetical protein